MKMRRSGMATGTPGRHLQRVAVRCLVAILSVGWGILIAPPTPADAQVRLSPEEARQLRMDEIFILDARELALEREICVSHQGSARKAMSEKKNGAGAFPEVHDYCLGVLRQSARSDQIGGLYLNLGLQQLDIGREWRFRSDGQALVTGVRTPDFTENKTSGLIEGAQARYAANMNFRDDAQDNGAVRIIRNVRTAAKDGLTSYINAAGRLRVLTCPLALDAGFSWAMANGKGDSRPELTDEQIGRMVVACYNPEIKEATIGTTGEQMTVQMMGSIAGERLGHRFELEMAAKSISANKQTNGR